MAHDVFISYSSNDQAAALAVLHGLEAAGVRCWMAPRDIPPGAIWAQAIMDGIAGCRALVVVFSANANRSSHVLTEVDAAVRKGAVIVPFRIEDVMPDGALEYHLRARHWLDALTPDREEHVAQLAQQLRALLASGRAPEPTTMPPRLAPDDLPTRRRTRRWRQLPVRRAMPYALGGLAVVLLGWWWLGRPRVVDDVTFTVHEVSAGGGNETTLRVHALGLRFFEGPAEHAEVAQRSYQDVFRQEMTRYLKTEIKLAYDPPGRVIRFPFACVLAREGAQIVTTLAINATVQPAWSESYHTQGWGTAEGGSWEPGRYRVECRYGQRLVGRNWFTVLAGGDEAPPDAPVAEAQPLAALEARVTAIRLFESGYDLPDRSTRIYAATFEAGKSRYINVEVGLAHQAAPGRVNAQLTCRFLRDRTTEVGRVTLTYDIGAGQTSHYAARGWGNRDGGTWTPGAYLVACDDGRTTLGQAGFTVT